MLAPTVLLLTCTVGPLAPAQDPVANPVTDFAYPRFGRAVSVLDDLDGDGSPEIAVGASRASTERFEECGAVLILSGADLELLRRVDGPWADLETGAGLHAVEDLDGDGCRDLLVLSEWGDLTRVVSPRTGATIWSQRPTQSWSGWLPGLVDENEDGVGDHLVDRGRKRDRWDVVCGRTGAILGRRPSSWCPGADRWRAGIRELLRATASGAALGGGRQLMVERLVPDIPQGESWGQLDFDGDGRRDLVVGLEVRSGRDGAVLHVWERPESLRAPDELDTDFGESMVFPGDLDGDGHDDCVIGAPGTMDGVLYAFSGAAPGQLIWKVGGAETVGMGISLAVLPDRDGDGVAELLVGATDRYPGDDGWRGAPGRIWILSGKLARLLESLDASEVEGLCSRPR